MHDLDVINHFITADEAVQILGCSKRSLRRYVKQGLVTKTGAGRGTKYSAASILYLYRNKDKGRLEQILSQLRSIQIKQQEINARLTLLESVLRPRAGTVDLDEEQLTLMKSELKTSNPTDFETMRDWSEDLVRLSPTTCKSLGIKCLLDFTNLLITRLKSLKDARRYIQITTCIDRLMWFKSLLAQYTTL